MVLADLGGDIAQRGVDPGIAGKGDDLQVDVLGMRLGDDFLQPGNVSRRGRDAILVDVRTRHLQTLGRPAHGVGSRGLYGHAHRLAQFGGNEGRQVLRRHATNLTPGERRVAHPDTPYLTCITTPSLGWRMPRREWRVKFGHPPYYGTSVLLD
ncbi:Uncharacterised protein [Mycobacteroides abscessus subsp. abscessus]|nr:Uncharacterised protein [Mycobacteroides abscessus subsp. abscessus]